MKLTYDSLIVELDYEDLKELLNVTEDFDYLDTSDFEITQAILDQTKGELKLFFTGKDK